MEKAISRKRLTIFYQEETWVFKNMACSQTWIDNVEDSAYNTFNVPSGKGERSILSHVSSNEQGLLEHCLLLYRGAKANKDADYLTEMTGMYSVICVRIVFSLQLLRQGKYLLFYSIMQKPDTVLDDEDRRTIRPFSAP